MPTKHSNNHSRQHPNKQSPSQTNPDNPDAQNSISNPIRRGRRQRQAPDTSEHKAPSVFKQLQNTMGYINPLRQDNIQSIHDNSMAIIRNHGIKVLSPTLRQHLKMMGCLVDDDSMIVRADEDFVMTHIALAPKQFTLTPRNPDKQIIVGGNYINFGMVSGPPNISDRTRGRQSSQFSDFIDLIKLGQMQPNINFFGNQTAATNDLNVYTRHLDSMLATLINSDKVSACMSVGQERVSDAIEMLAIARGISTEDMKLSPSAITNINVNSPRVLDTEMSDAALAMAALNQATIVTPFTLMGAMAPVSLPAALSQQNAEALFVIAMIESVSPGAPVVYGGFTSNVDMKTGSPAFGTPENAIANLAGGQLCRHYGLPYRSSACSASNIPDAQAAFETQMSLWGAVFGGANMIYHAAGWMEGGLVACYEKVMLDGDMIDAFAKMLTPIDFSPDELGFDAIGEVAPGGHFFGHNHTLDRYKTAFFAPILSDWQTFENWQANGSKTAFERAEDKWKDVLNLFEPPPLDPDIADALHGYVAKRKEVIGDRPL